MSGFADKRRTAGFTIEICQAERASATAEAEDPPGRLPRHHRRSRAGDRMHKQRWKTAGGGKYLLSFVSLSTYIYVYTYIRFRYTCIYINRITRD